MGQKNSKVIPSNEIKEIEGYFTCRLCNLKIHSSCIKYYIKNKIDISLCMKCYQKYIDLQ